MDPAEPTGDYVEFGVSRGTSLACMSHALADENVPGVRMLGFDSFRDLPLTLRRRDGGPVRSTHPGARQRAI